MQIFFFHRIGRELTIALENNCFMALHFIVPNRFGHELPDESFEAICRNQTAKNKFCANGHSVSNHWPSQR
jgi:hypothetical protein